ncbi:MAG TPA: SH3 domain-containing protein [Candidatus Binatia bacterium]|nr:SH3 domain-containing protein [Candidatus Binatia bacterium]
MVIRAATLCSALFCCMLFLAASPSLRAAAAPALTAREPGTPLYARQDRESEPILRLPKGEALTPLAESLGSEIWYLVRTTQGQTGWVRAADVGASEQVKESFIEKEPESSNWSLGTSDGRTFNGSYSVDPKSTDRSARGVWSLRDANGNTVLRGAWSAQMNSTGWNGTWRASVQNRQGELNGRWSAELPTVGTRRFAAMFELAAKEVIKGSWTGVDLSGTWSIKTFKPSVE